MLICGGPATDPINSIKVEHVAPNTGLLSAVSGVKCRGMLQDTQTWHHKRLPNTFRPGLPSVRLSGTINKMSDIVLPSSLAAVRKEVAFASMRRPLMVGFMRLGTMAPGLDSGSISIRYNGSSTLNFGSRSLTASPFHVEFSFRTRDQLSSRNAGTVWEAGGLSFTTPILRCYLGVTSWPRGNSVSVRVYYGAAGNRILEKAWDGK